MDVSNARPPGASIEKNDEPNTYIHLEVVEDGFAHLRGTNILETNVLSKFHENWAKNVTSTVFINMSCFHCIHIEKNAPPWFFLTIPTIFKLVRDINKTNVLTNFHDDWAKIVTSRVFTTKTAPLTGSHVFQRIEPFTMTCFVSFKLMR
ncbi:hypothetical protein DPMN_190798 [Dreissena polymorpha]|uniref:Uncharacterized protein n=1 Tax=Dreissena polymorpha TaxID=45954 RepID=A0A9D3Y065_DREPO|nr:hypothetical protein DPMN_190798 [Dreissena polymorpha]